MDDLLLDLATLLKDNNVVPLGDGKDIFRDKMPETPTTGTLTVALLEYAGTPIPGTESAVRNIQIQVRDASYAACKRKAHDIYKFLTKADDPIFQLAGREFVGAPRQTPFKLKEDSTKRTIYAFNYRLIIRND